MIIIEEEDESPFDMVPDEDSSGDVLALRIAQFVANPQFLSKIVGAEFKPTSRSGRSPLNDCGIRAVDANGCEWFICMVDPCFSKSTLLTIKCSKTGNSNALTHLRQVHGITSEKTQAANVRMKKIATQLDLSDPAFKRDPLRWFQVCPSLLNRSLDFIKTSMTIHRSSFSQQNHLNLDLDLLIDRLMDI